jgi:hypothetical protein
VNSKLSVPKPAAKKENMPNNLGNLQLALLSQILVVCNAVGVVGCHTVAVTVAVAAVTIGKLETEK